MSLPTQASSAQDDCNDGSDPRLDLVTPLRPANAVAAIITAGGRYLLQLRDSKRGVLFPGHWGCFGGAVESGESCAEALARELDEELHLVIAPPDARYFSRFDFDLGFAGLAPIWRFFYHLEIEPERVADLRLNEGAALGLFSPPEILTGAIPLTPYDAFALWFHINSARLR